MTTANFFTTPAEYLSQHGIACFAYDQRGFGIAPKRGLWAGQDAYIDDLQVLIRLLKQRYPDRPVYLLGEKHGGRGDYCRNGTADHACC